MQNFQNNEVQELNAVEVETVSGASWAGAAFGGAVGAEFGPIGIAIGVVAGAILL